MNRKISIETSFQWAQRFVAREWRLALPLVLAFLFLPQLVMSMAIPAEVARIMATSPMGGVAGVGPALAWLIPLLLLVLVAAAIGSLALSALALKPGVSVGEAIMIGLRRVPVLVVAMVLIFLAVLIVATILSMLFLLLAAGILQTQQLLMFVTFVAIITLFVRLALIGPVIVERRVGPIDAITTSWRMARGNFWRMMGTTLVYLVGGSVVLLALNMAVGAALLLITRAMGAPDLGVTLAGMFSQAGGAILNAGFALLFAAFYRQLAEPSRGT